VTGTAGDGGQASPSTRPDFAPAATTGPVPRRVAALLHPSEERSRATRCVALLLAVCAFLSVAAGAVGVVHVHHEVEIAQGEEGP
jgi:hypothetical protein